MDGFDGLFDSINGAVSGNVAGEVAKIVGDVPQQAKEGMNSVKHVVIGIVAVVVLIAVGSFVLKKIKNRTGGGFQ